MALLTKKQFEELAGFHGAHCVSIFMPAQRYGHEIREGKLRIEYERHLREVRDELGKRGLKPLEVDRFLAPARELAEQSGFWSRLSDGLVVYIGENFFRHLTLPIRFENFNYIADHLYVRPLMPMFSGDGRFFVLGLALEGVSFYEGSRYQLTEVYVQDLTPARLQEVVGYDYEQQSLQWRSTGGGLPGHGAIYHSQGEANLKRKEEILQYCRAVDRGLMKMLFDLRDPLVVASVEYLFPIYKEANTYKNLIAERHVNGQPEYMDMALLHEKAWEVVEPRFDKVLQDKLRQYDELRHTARTSYDVDEIVAAAVHGRVDTLFLQTRADTYGIYDPAANKVSIDEHKNLANASLGNLAAVRTFLQDGKVFLLEPGQMPEKDTLVNALFRY